MKKNIAVIVSKRFHPGHTSHLIANGKMLNEQGYNEKYRISNQAKGVVEFDNAKLLNGLAPLFRLQSNDLFIVWFPSFAALIEITIVRLFTKATVVYVLHEPFVSFKHYLKSGFSVIQVLRIGLISLINKISCILSAKVILPSITAFKAKNPKKSQLNKYVRLNLLYLDEASTHAACERRFISYVGTIAEDHAFSEFVDLMHDCIFLRNKKYLFLIATRSNVPGRYIKKINECVSAGYLVLHSGSSMTNNEINLFYASSIVIWNAYRRSMQSGVLPKAYMFGTPVLVSECNQSEFFENGNHGVLLSKDYLIDEYIEGIEMIMLNWLRISNNCRLFFSENFDYRSQVHSFMRLIER